MSVPAATFETRPAELVHATGATRSFAQRRLLLGITGVGASVVISAVWLLLLLGGVVNAPPNWRAFGLELGGAGGPFSAMLLSLCVFAAHAVLLVGLEYVGGTVVVRQVPSRGAWLLGWARGVLVQAGIFGSVMFAAALAAQLLGWFGLVSVVLGACSGLLLLQGQVARLIAPITLSRADEELGDVLPLSGIRAESVRVVDVADEAFVGGWVGLVKPQLWIPRAWIAHEQQTVLRAQLARRHAQFVSGARRRGLWRSAMWPTLGVALFVPMLPWSYTDANLWLALPALSTLWTFVAVLLLPSVSRPVVYSADAAAAKRVGVDDVVTALRQLDAWQDDEPERSRGVEFIFHPVPSRNNRERALRHRTRPVMGGGHQQTRLTLFTSLAAGGLLGRVVHCNIGRPNLWAVYPGD